MSARFSIVIVKGPSVGETFSFDQSIVRIGRTAAENDLVLNDRSIKFSSQNQFKNLIPHCGSVELGKKCLGLQPRWGMDG